MKKHMKMSSSVMLFLKMVILIPAVLVGYSSVWAQVSATDVLGKSSECSDTRDATDIVRSDLNAWLDSDYGQKQEARNDRGEIVLAISDPIKVMAQATSSEFGKSRVFAYDKALLNAQAKYVKIKQNRTETELATSRFDSNPPLEEMRIEGEEREGRLMRIGDKFFALTEAQLDSALREEGIDVETIEKMDPSKKLDKYRESVGRKTVTTAISRIAGMVPIVNIEAIDCSGSAAVATIAVYSDILFQYAQDVASGKPITASPEKATGKTLGASIREQIRTNDIPFTVGLRYVYDQDGFPSLISYGQWAFISTGSTSRDRERAKQTALNFAEDAARSQIALYLKGSITLMNESGVSEESSEVATITRNDVSTEQVSQIIEEQLRTASAKATVNITGVREIGQWTSDYPEMPGVQMVGKVLAWSPQFADAIRSATATGIRQAVNPAANSQPERNSNDAVLRRSSVNDNMADF